MFFRVYGYGGSEISNYTESTSYLAVDIPFTTGSTNTSATINMWDSTSVAGSWGYVDDVQFVTEPVTLVDESFNFGTTGQAPLDWTVGDSTLVTVQEVPSVSDKSMYVNNTSGFSGNLNATKTFTPQISGILTETLKFRLSQLNVNVSLGYLQDSSGTSAASVFYDGSGQKLMYVTSDNVYHDLPGGTGLTANTWYNLKVVANKNNNTYDIYFIDMANAKVTGASFRNNVSISQVQCGVNDLAGSNVSAYFNDIKMIK